MYAAASKHAVLTREEEMTLGRAVVAGQKASVRIKAEGKSLSMSELRHLRAVERAGVSSRNLFVEHNLRLAMNTAARFARAQSRVGYEDLIQEATLGVMRAVDKFDPERGFKFSTYATWWMRPFCQRAIANSGRTIKLPPHVEADVRELAATMEELSAMQQSTSMEAVADELKWDYVKARKIWDYWEGTHMESIDDIMFDDEDGPTRGDSVADDRVSTEDEGIRSSFARDILEAIAGLPDDEREVLVTHHGLDKDWEPRTLSDTAKILGLSRERVKSLETKAISRLRHPSSGMISAFEEFGSPFGETRYTDT